MATVPTCSLSLWIDLAQLAGPQRRRSKDQAFTLSIDTHRPGETLCIHLLHWPWEANPWIHGNISKINGKPSRMSEAFSSVFGSLLYQHEFICCSRFVIQLNTYWSSKYATIFHCRHLVQFFFAEYLLYFTSPIYFSLLCVQLNSFIAF